MEMLTKDPESISILRSSLIAELEDVHLEVGGMVVRAFWVSRCLRLEIRMINAVISQYLSSLPLFNQSK